MVAVAALATWAVFGWLIVNNALGDLLLMSGWRSRSPEPRPRGATFVLVLLAALGL